MRRVQASAGRGRECEAHPGEEARQIRLDGRLGRRALEEKVVLASLELANLGAPAAVADPAILSAVAWAPVVAERALRDERLLRHHRDRPGRLRTCRHSGLIRVSCDCWQHYLAGKGGVQLRALGGLHSTVGRRKVFSGDASRTCAAETTPFDITRPSVITAAASIMAELSVGGKIHHALRQYLDSFSGT